MGVRQEILECAKAYLGEPYLSIYGGNGPEDGGFTCSGFTWRAYHDAGVEIPNAQGIHSYYTKSYNGWETQAGWVLNHGHFTEDEEDLEIGDLVFYSPVWDMEQTGHVAIYVGDGMVIHANGSPVAITPLGDGGNFAGGGCPLVELPDDESLAMLKVRGTVRFKYGMFVRDYPSTTEGNKVGDGIVYKEGEACNIDGIVFNDNRAWGHYAGASSKKVRYVALTDEALSFVEVVE